MTVPLGVWLVAKSSVVVEAVAELVNASGIMKIVDRNVEVSVESLLGTEHRATTTTISGGSAGTPIVSRGWHRIFRYLTLGEFRARYTAE